MADTQQPTTPPLKKRILLVEDDTLIRELYGRILRGVGYDVDEAEDGQKGYTAMLEGGYDLILLDIMLPFMDGLQILEKLSKETPPKRPNGAVLILTNLDQDLTIAKGLSYGIRGYLIKSQCTPEQLKREVENCFTMTS